MFGMLIDSERSDAATGRFARRRFAGHGRFRDVDWGALAAASAALTMQVVNAATKNNQNTTAGGAPYAQPQCPPGFFYNPANGMCQDVAPGGGLFSNLSPTMIAVGGGLLLVILLGRD